MLFGCWILPLAVSTSLEFGLPVTVALSAVALIGYLFGNRTRTKMVAEIDGRRQHELDRAARIAWQLETIASGLRQDLVGHHAQLAIFKRQLRQAQDAGDDKAWERLCSEAESMLGQTMQLAHQLSNAYDQIRQQSEALETFTQGRTDPLTGVGNGRALEQQLRVLLSGAYRGNPTFTVALLSLDRTGGSIEGRSLTNILPLLPKLASVIRTCMRESDFVARYGDDEFVVVMPQTTLVGARVFANRVRKRATDELSNSVCCGLTEVQPDDDARALLARADSALYSAKAAGTNRLFVHAGGHIREDQTAPNATAAEEVAAVPKSRSGRRSTTSENPAASRDKSADPSAAPQEIGASATL
jgi:diguanylate cyclase (GGDEF)-like protein